MNGAVSPAEYDRVRSFLLRVEQERPDEIATDEFFAFLGDLSRTFPNRTREHERAPAPKPAEKPKDDLMMFLFGGAVGCAAMMLFNLLLG
jgi:hypothetical protein